MDKVHRQHGSIVLYEEKKDGEQYIRIAYADNPVIAPMLSQEPGISLDGNGNAYIKASDFRLPIFHDRYSPHTYIDYSRLYAGLPKSKREYTFPKLHPDEDTITDRIERLKEWVDQSSLGHLPLPLRIDLMKRIGNIRVIQKIQCECCKMEKPRDFDPFGHAGFAHLWLQYDCPFKVLVLGVNIILPF